MLFFENDYGEGAHEKILKRFAETNREKTSGYGNDPYCESAKEKIKKACECPEAEVHFLTGGTQTNSIVVRTMLRPWEGVIAAETGHVSVHEAGAIEASGHKVLTLPQKAGKICAEDLQHLLEVFYEDPTKDHMVFPGMVYLSHPTEYGTLYSKEELKAIRAVCDQFEIPLYLDGARLGYGLVSSKTDVTLPDVAKLCDVFYIGGTKVGALCGEAVVFTRQNTPKQFLTMVKQSGALLAKGRVLGIQFDTLFTENLYWEISRQAIAAADRIKEVLREEGYELYLDSPTNQIFVVLEDTQMERLKQEVVFSFWEKKDADHTVVRFVTSWATQMEDVEALGKILRKD